MTYRGTECVGVCVVYVKGRETVTEWMGVCVGFVKVRERGTE